MGLMDKLTAGIEWMAEGADKAIDKGKAKVGELQIEMQMDGQAKKLGYLVFDFYRGRQVDQDLRQQILDDMSRLEDQLIKARAEAAAKAEAEAAWKAQRAAQTAGTEAGPGAWEAAAPPPGAEPAPAAQPTQAAAAEPPREAAPPGETGPEDTQGGPGASPTGV
jgi:hypothetical protein